MSRQHRMSTLAPHGESTPIQVTDAFSQHRLIRTVIDRQIRRNGGNHHTTHHLTDIKHIQIALVLKVVGLNPRQPRVEDRSTLKLGIPVLSFAEFINIALLGRWVLHLTCIGFDLATLLSVIPHCGHDRIQKNPNTNEN